MFKEADRKAGGWPFLTKVVNLSFVIPPGMLCNKNGSNHITAEKEHDSEALNGQSLAKGRGRYGTKQEPTATGHAVI